MRLIALSALLLLALATQASADLRANVTQCAGLLDLELRLACFDALKQIAAKSGDSGAIGSEIAECGGGELGRLDCYDTLARKFGPEEVDTASAEAESTDGKSKIKKSAIPKTFTSVLTGARRGMTGVWMLELENGQVWRELEPTPGSNYRAGDELTFKKGYFGAFRMKNERTKIGTKVKNLR